MSLATWRENNPKIAENLTVVKDKKDATSYIIHGDAKKILQEKVENIALKWIFFILKEMQMMAI